MHSLKSTAIAVVLLAVSIGLYQVSSTEDTTTGTDLTMQLAAPANVIDSNGFGQPMPAAAPNGQSGSQMKPQYNGGLADQYPSQPVGRYPSQQTSPYPQNATAQLPTYRNQPGMAAPNAAPVSFGNNAAPALNSFAQSAPTLTVPSAYPSLQTPTAPSARLAAPQTTPASSPALAAPSFDQLRKSYDQATSTTDESLHATAAGLVDQSLARAANTLDAAKGQFASSFDNLGSSLQQNLPQATSAIRAPIPSNRDQGLIDALKSEFDTSSSDMPSLSSAIEATQQTIASAAPTNSFDSSNDFMSSGGSSSTTAPSMTEAPKPAPTSSDFMADSEFPAQPIGSSNDSINSLASGHRSDAADLDSIKLANLAPEAAAKSAMEAPARIDDAWKQVDTMVAEKNFHGALELLTKYYRQKNLDAAQRKRLNDWLDALAGKVIYSAEHHFSDTPYTIRSGETLNDIAGRWGVPAQVVYNINRQQLGNKSTIVAGTELKTISGPFHAEVNLSTKTLTLFLKNLYAGRFPIRAGISGNPSPGSYNAVAKSAQGHTWRDGDGNDFPPESSENAYGPYWIGLTGSLCIHAISNDTPEGHNGCIGLRENDARDIYGILSAGSAIKIVQ